MKIKNVEKLRRNIIDAFNAAYFNVHMKWIECVTFSKIQQGMKVEIKLRDVICVSLFSKSNLHICNQELYIELDVEENELFIWKENDDCWCECVGSIMFDLIDSEMELALELSDKIFGERR